VTNTTVSFTAMTCGTNYAVSLTGVNTGGNTPNYGGSNFISAGSKTSTGFTITNRQLLNGAAVGASTGGIGIDWIAICNRTS